MNRPDNLYLVNLYVYEPLWLFIFNKTVNIWTAQSFCIQRTLTLRTILPNVYLYTNTTIILLRSQTPPSTNRNKTYSNHNEHISIARVMNTQHLSRSLHCTIPWSSVIKKLYDDTLQRLPYKWQPCSSPILQIHSITAHWK